MPRWPDELSDCTVFLYETRNDADSGKNTGGSGFLLGVPWETDPSKTHVYVVSNYHVTKGGTASVIRLNTKKGKAACIETEPTEWFHIHGRDLAVYRIDETKHLGPGSIFDYKFSSFPEIQLTDDLWNKYQLGIGDEVVSVGRFVDLSGVQRNQPFLRSGILSSGRVLPVGQAPGMPWTNEPSYIVEMRSRTGFSGSPVYIFIDWMTSRMVDVDDAGDTKTAYELFKGPWLLGVQWGQLPIVGPDAVDTGATSSAMLAVVPCSALTELLMENDDVIRERGEYEDHQRSAVHATAELAPPTKADNPQHREDFNRLLDAAVPENKSDR